MVIDLTNYGPGLGTQVAFAMDVAGIYANKNTIPNEPVSPFYPSGVRIGTPLVTSRGMKEAQMRQIARWIAQVIQLVKEEQLPTEKAARGAFLKAFRARTLKNKELLAIRKEVKNLCRKFPLKVKI
jgi:glycine hydroxymethyltransferase